MGWPGAAGFGAGVAGVGRRRVGDGANSRGPLDRENATSSEGANKKGKCISTEMPSTHGADGPLRMALVYRGREVGGAGWAKGQVGR
jgi:hypothetical protein